MKFDYIKFTFEDEQPLFGKYVLKPIVPIEVFYGEVSRKYLALVDSGADFCIFDAEIAESLEIDVQKGEKIPFGGIQTTGKQALAYLHEVTLGIGGNKHNARVGFSYDIAKNGYGIVGQLGFFDHFKVIFDINSEQVELRPKK